MLLIPGCRWKGGKRSSPSIYSGGRVGKKGGGDTEVAKTCHKRRLPSRVTFIWRTPERKERRGEEKKEEPILLILDAPWGRTMDGKREESIHTQRTSFDAEGKKKGSVHSAGRKGGCKVLLINKQACLKKRKKHMALFEKPNWMKGGRKRRRSFATTKKRGGGRKGTDMKFQSKD